MFDEIEVLKRALRENPRQLEPKIALGKLLVRLGMLDFDEESLAFGVKEALALAGVIDNLDKTSRQFLISRFSAISGGYDSNVLSDEYEFREPDLVSGKLLSLVCGRDVSCILDVGCGTGIVGERLREYGVNCRLDGIDPSRDMLERAVVKCVYDGLYVSYFEDSQEILGLKYDFIVASSSVQFVGNVSEWLSVARSLLNDDGYFIFTFDFCDSADYEVNESLYFRHSPNYIACAAGAHGFSVKISEHGLRSEKTVGHVKGGVAILRKN